MELSSKRDRLQTEDDKVKNICTKKLAWTNMSKTFAIYCRYEYKKDIY